jgi:hypothetical protein
MSAIIWDLEKPADQGRGDDVRQKLRLLSKRWEAFRKGGDGPPLFCMEIVAIGAPGETRPAERGNR